ncbi:hypothetical protein F511_29796 [Dorcoceras hygrometricum]|uniref:Uncharacterized protein n=1 Tax=Dorcoceras hygrometricum TaxID=472368 RepID=A0A2Z7C457_9LAMI|nr:hypothetical protein F511_29796 [Dorcoceras hygrometricum]
MATSFGSTNATAASVAENARKSSPFLPLYRRHLCRSASFSKMSFCFSAKPQLRLSSKGLHGWNCSTVVRAQSNQVAVDESSKGGSSNPVKPEASPAEAKDITFSKESPSASLASEESISEFMNQVSNLVKYGFSVPNACSCLFQIFIECNFSDAGWLIPRILWNCS